MGDGKKLKEYLDEKGTNVRRIAKETGISATTLYTIIQKDSNIRFDFALRLANALDIDVNEICSASPFSGAITEEEIYPTLPDGLNGALDASRVKTYLKNSLGHGFKPRIRHSISFALFVQSILPNSLWIFAVCVALLLSCGV